MNDRINSALPGPKVEYMHSPGQRAGQATLRRKLCVRQLYDWLLQQDVALFALPGWTSDGQHVWLNMQSHLSPHILCKLDLYKVVDPRASMYSVANQGTAVALTSVVVKADAFFIDREHLEKNPKPTHEDDPIGHNIWRTPYLHFQTAVTIPV